MKAALSTITTHLSRRRHACLASALVLLTGMAYSFLWAPVVEHHSYWITTSDLWIGVFQPAAAIANGRAGWMYVNTTLVTFPGFSVLLAPVALLIKVLHLTVSAGGLRPHPSAWLVLGPFEILAGCSALFATDSLAERLGVSSRSRFLIAIFEGAALWNVSVIWGHPEDAVATAFALYALLAIYDRRLRSGAWLFGAAVACQPFVLMIFPVLVAMVGRKRFVGLCMRAAMPAIGVVSVPILQQPRATLHALLDQPNYPVATHFTPWTALAPRIHVPMVALVNSSGRKILVSPSPLIVAAGPGRLLGLILACALGLWAVNHREDLTSLTWICALCLCIRPLTESALLSYYMWPTLALGLVVASRRGTLRAWAAGSVALATGVVGDWRSYPWGLHDHVYWLPWWMAVTAGMLAVLIFGIAPLRHRGLAATRARLVPNDRSAIERAGPGVLAPS